MAKFKRETINAPACFAGGFEGRSFTDYVVNGVSVNSQTYRKAWEVRGDEKAVAALVAADIAAQVAAIPGARDSIVALNSPKKE